MAPNNNDEWLRDQLNNIEKKVDRLDQRADNIDVTLAKQSVELKEHVRRSLANEKSVELLKENIDINKAEFNEKIKPIESHITQVHVVFKIIGLCSAIIGFIIMILNAFHISF